MSATPILGSASRGANLTWLGRLEARVDSFFLIGKRGSTLGAEVRAGTTAFLAASNNFAVNAQIMKHAGIDSRVSVVSGAFAAAMTCIISGFLSNLPLGLVPSVGPNVFIAFSLVAKKVVNTDQALAISWACGVLLLTLSVTPVLKLILGLVPLCIKYGLIIGTGLLTALIGMKQIGVVVPDTSASHDIVALGILDDTQVIIAATFLVVMASMLHRGVKGAVLIGMLGATITDWFVAGDWPSTFFSLESLTPHALEFSVLMNRNAWVQACALLLMLLFSISGAVIGSARMAGLLREDGSVPGSTAVYISCGIGTMFSATLGCSPIFVSMSAAAGIRDGGRTGLMSVVVGLWSLLTALVLSPLAADIPACAVAPVLILVGVSMMGEAQEVQWWSMQDALPAFLCAVFQPFTYSVSNGIYVGVAMSFVLFFTTGSFLTYLPSYRRKRAESLKSRTPKGLLTASAGIAHGGLSSSMSSGVLFGHGPAHTQEEMRESIASKLNYLGSFQPSAGLVPNKTMPHLGRAFSRSRLPTRLAISAADLPETAVSLTSSKDELALRGHFQDVGRSARLKAMALIEQAAHIVGLDSEEVRQVVEERLLGGGRNTEGHAIGGICGFEAEIAREEIQSSAHDLAGLAAMEAPRFAAAARRDRIRRHETSDVGRLDIIQTQGSL